MNLSQILLNITLQILNCFLLLDWFPYQSLRFQSPLLLYLHVCMDIYVNIDVHGFVCVCVCVYIYIYIYSHPQTDFFILSELFSVARHAGRSKLGSKLIQLS